MTDLKQIVKKILSYFATDALGYYFSPQEGVGNAWHCQSFALLKLCIAKA